MRALVKVPGKVKYMIITTLPVDAKYVLQGEVGEGGAYSFFALDR